MSSHETGPCVWITRENWEQHGADYDDYHVHIIEDETRHK